MKGILISFLIVVLAFSLVGCQGDFDQLEPALDEVIQVEEDRVLYSDNIVNGDCEGFWEQMEEERVPKKNIGDRIDF